MNYKRPVRVLLEENKSHLTKAEIERRMKEEEALRPADDNTDCPEWLTDTFAREEYARIAVELERLGLLTNLDVNTLAAYCVAYSRYVEATQQMEGEPLTVVQTNKNGITARVENPLIKIQLKYSDEMKRLSNEMGLSISSRLRLVPPKKEEKPKNKFSEFTGKTG